MEKKKRKERRKLFWHRDKFHIKSSSKKRRRYAHERLITYIRIVPQESGALSSVEESSLLTARGDACWEGCEARMEEQQEEDGPRDGSGLRDRSTRDVG